MSEAVCLNCTADLHGPFCHACGQKAVHPVAGVHDFVHEVTHEFLHLDGKILSTVRLLTTKPGQLTREFIEGRRARYISPLRVYLTCSLIFFFLAAVVPGATDTFIRIKDASSAQTAQLTEALLHNMPRAVFLLMPAFALLTWLLYRRRQPYYIPHLYYSIHFHAFAFLVLTTTVLLGLAGRPGKFLGSLIFLAVFPYHYLGLRRMFGERALLKGTVIGVLYWIVLALAMVGLAWVTIKSAH